MLCNQTLNSSVDYMGCSVLWMLSLMIGNSVKVQVKTGWIETGILWIAIVGRPGVGKTPNINNVIFPLQKANNNEVKKYIDQMDRYKNYQALDKQKKEDYEEVKKPDKGQFIASDITIEALVELHEENKNAVGVFKDDVTETEVKLLKKALQQWTKSNRFGRRIFRIFRNCLLARSFSPV